MDLISLYTSLLAEKRAEYGEARDRLLNGLNKLQQTNAVVDTMQAQLNQLQPVLEEKAQVTPPPPPNHTLLSAPAASVCVSAQMTVLLSSKHVDCHSPCMSAVPHHDQGVCWNFSFCLGPE